MQIRLYLDEDTMTRTLVNALRARGADVTTVFEEGMTGRNDTDQLEYASQHERVLYSFNARYSEEPWSPTTGLPRLEIKWIRTDIGSVS